MICEPFVRRRLERAPNWTSMLGRGKAIEAAGYHQQVKVTSASTCCVKGKNGAPRPCAAGATASVWRGLMQWVRKRIRAKKLLGRIDRRRRSFNRMRLLRRW